MSFRIFLLALSLLCAAAPADTFNVTPWAQVVWQSTAFGGVDSAWVENAEFVNAESLQMRSGLRAAATFGAFVPYVGVAVAHDVWDAKQVIVDGFEYGTGMGATRLEVAAGFQAGLMQSLQAYADVKGAYGIGADDVTSYEGSAGVRLNW